CMAKRQGGGFGFIMLLVVMAIVLLLASKAWKAISPTALDVNSAEKDAAGGTATGKTTTKSTSLDLPPAPVNSGAGQRMIQSSVSDMKKKTDAHSGQVQKALGD